MKLTLTRHQGKDLHIDIFFLDYAPLWNANYILYTNTRLSVLLQRSFSTTKTESLEDHEAI